MKHAHQGPADTSRFGLVEFTDNGHTFAILCEPEFAQWVAAEMPGESRAARKKRERFANLLCHMRAATRGSER